MTMRPWIVLAVAAFAAVAPGAVRAEPCTAAPKLLELGAPLTQTRAAVVERKALTVVAIGTASTLGYGSSSPRHSYPAVMLRNLARYLPGVRVRVITFGIDTRDPEELFIRFDVEVLPEKPDLVIWQFGTNAALAQIPVDQMTDRLKRGAERIRSGGADLVLMTPQYAPALTALDNIDSYTQAMDHLARTNGLGLFRRFEITRSWVDDQHLSFSDFIQQDGLHLNDFGYRCVGRLLASAILAAVQPQAAPAAGDRAASP